MAYDERLAGRVRDVLGVRPAVTERKMFGGIGWMIGGHLALGVWGDELIVRLDPEEAQAALTEPGVRPFDSTGRPMRGFVLVAVDPDDEPQLAGWVDAGAGFAASLPPKA